MGKCVSLIGLQRAELNGNAGCVHSYNQATERLAQSTVELDQRPGQRMAVKPMNLALEDNVDGPE